MIMRMRMKMRKKIKKKIKEKNNLKKCKINLHKKSMSHKQNKKLRLFK
jgi:hypothetical protein